MAHNPKPAISFFQRVGSLFLLLALSACATAQSPAPTAGAQLSPSPALPTETALPTPIPPATQSPASPTAPSGGWKAYTDSATSLSFQFPPAWFGPDVYSFDQGVRLEVGSDKVYPYGTDPTERVYELKNSYYVTIQYTRNSNNWTLEEYRQNQPWIETYLSMLDLKDGESRSGGRDLETRVRKFQLGKFEGLEFIATLSDTAQTDMTYARQVVLLDDKLNALVITGMPNNVEIADKTKWKDAYSQIDLANLETFRKIVESITISE